MKIDPRDAVHEIICEALEDVKLCDPQNCPWVKRCNKLLIKQESLISAIVNEIQECPSCQDVYKEQVRKIISEQMD